MLTLLRPRDPAASPSMLPKTGARGAGGRWRACVVALVLVVLSLGVEAAPATCSGWSMPRPRITTVAPGEECCVSAGVPDGAAGAHLSSGARGCCCPPGGPCDVARSRQAVAAVLPGDAGRGDASGPTLLDLNAEPGPLFLASRTAPLPHPPAGPLFLRVGVLRI